MVEPWDEGERLDPVGHSSAEQHNTAAHLYSAIIVRLAPGTVPRVPLPTIRSTPRPWKTERRNFAASKNQKFQLYTLSKFGEQQVKENSELTSLKCTSNLQIQNPNFVSRRSVTPCPSSTPSCCGTTRTCSRSIPTGPPAWWTRRSCAERRLKLICSWAEASPRFYCLLFTL